MSQIQTTLTTTNKNCDVCGGHQTVTEKLIKNATVHYHATCDNCSYGVIRAATHDEKTSNIPVDHRK